MPNRILRESICTSDTIDKLSWFEEVLYYRLIVNCDDFGRFDGRTVVIKNRLFPLKDNLTLKTVEAALHGLANAGLVALYEFEGRRFLCLPTWGKYQTQRAKVSKYPAQSDGTPSDASTRNLLQADEIICKQMKSSESKCSRIRESNSLFENRESRCESNARETRFTPPSIADVEQYCREKGYHINAERFVCFYAQKGWMVGKNRMKDWKRAVQGWETRWKDEQKNAQHGFSYDYGSTEDSL